MSKKARPQKPPDRPQVLTPEQLGKLNAEVHRRQQQESERLSKLPEYQSPHHISSFLPEVEGVFSRIKAQIESFALETEPDFALCDEVEVCEKHNYARKKNWSKTLEASWAAQSFVIQYDTCPLCEDKEAQNVKRRFWARRGVPDRLLDATLQNFDTTGANGSDKALALHAAKQFLHGFLILVGSTGTGKGHLAVGCLKREGEGQFITHGDLISELRATYDDNTPRAKERFYAKYCETPFLVLDEVGVRTAGKDEEDLLYRVLSYRHDKKLLTALTSNEEIPKLKEILGFRLADRIGEDKTTITCKWPSRRKSSSF